MKIDFTNKTVLVTGGTRGIGEKIGQDLIRLGANVIMTGTNHEQVEKLNNENSKKGLACTYFTLDALNSKSIDLFLSDLLDKFTTIDCIVNNAGINRLNYIHETVNEDWQDMINVNLTLPFRLLQQITPIMIKNKFGRIVNISSIFGKISREKRSIYSATKFGIHGLTVGASNDLARYNVLVNTVSPGFIDTDLTRKNLSNEEINILAETIPTGRLGETKDISTVIAFLLSDLNQYITGQNIIIDGGFTNI